MKLLKLFFSLFLCFILSTAYAQPEEHKIIHQIIQEPDELISAEFNVIGTNRIYSVNLKSNRSIFELHQLFKQNVNLNLLSVEHIFPDTWNLMLTNKETSRLDFVKFNEIAELNWQHNPEHPLKIILNKATVTVVVTQNNPMHAAENLETAGNNELQLTNTTRLGQLQTNTFTLALKQEEFALPSGFNEPETEFSKDLKKFAEIEDGHAMDKSEQYHLKLNIEDFPAILESIKKHQMSLTFIEFFTLDSQNCEVKIRTRNGTSEQSRKFQFLKHLISEKPLPMAKDGYSSKEPVVTGFETKMANKITILGFSPKSGLIFSQLMPVIQFTPGLKHPFFSRGTNKMTNSGKVMQFKIDCDW